MNAVTPLPPISVQLYSLRDQTAVDFPAVLARLGAKGYPGVELAGLSGLTPEQLSHALTVAGLGLSSAHVGLDVDGGFEHALDLYQSLGCDTVVIPSLPHDAFSNLDDVRAAADRINEAAESTRSRGVTLGYHNHWWEFVPMTDGRPALVHLFDHLAPDVIAEVDIYWAKVAGADPKELVAELGSRVGLLHVKDGPADAPPSPMVAVGDGVIDVPGVLAGAPNARWHIVELDRCATDMFDAVERSYDYLVGNGYSRGNA
ncbi:MAG: sugar phosphate isomerase/epimerase family protein [Acidimicrobiia bacterium]